MLKVVDLSGFLWYLTILLINEGRREIYRNAKTMLKNIVYSYKICSKTYQKTWWIEEK